MDVLTFFESDFSFQPSNHPPLRNYFYSVHQYIYPTKHHIVCISLQIIIHHLIKKRPEPPIRKFFLQHTPYIHPDQIMVFCVMRGVIYHSTKRNCEKKKKKNSAQILDSKMMIKCSQGYGTIFWVCYVFTHCCFRTFLCGFRQYVNHEKYSRTVEVMSL